MSCDVGEVTESLENELCYDYELSSFSKLTVTSPASQLILEPLPRFTYVTAHSPTLPLFHLRHSLFSNPSLASPTSQDFHLRHLASRPLTSPMPGPPPRQHKHERQYTPSTHSVIPTRRIWNYDYDGQMIFGDICLTGEEKPRKNLNQETCPDRGSNSGPLRDRRACYHLFHSGGRVRYLKLFIMTKTKKTYFSRIFLKFHLWVPLKWRENP